MGEENDEEKNNHSEKTLMRTAMLEMVMQQVQMKKPMRARKMVRMVET